MSIIRSLDLFSLPELFRSIENDSRSGRLIVETPISQDTAKRKGIYYVWFKDGHLIAFSNCLNQKGLINLIDRREWLSPVVIRRLRKLCPTGVPLGIYLQNVKLLNQEKLNLIFQLQLHQVYSLFQMDGGRFRFDDFAELQNRIVTVPWLEMTGQQIKTTEASMYALRLMENSENFVGQLPIPSQILKKIVTQPHLKLIATERQLWEMADGKTSLSTIARKLDQPISVIQMTGFRLIAVGLVDSIFQSQQGWLAKNDVAVSQSQVAQEMVVARSIVPLNEEKDNDQYSKEQKSWLDTLGSLFKKKNM